MNEAEIWRTAHDMIQQYGADAEARAKFRAGKLLEVGMTEDAEEWNRVAQAIAELARKKPGADDPVN